MSKKIFSLKNYLEPIDLENTEEEEEREILFSENSFSGPYPFTKETLLKYLETEKFLLSFKNQNENAKMQEKDGKFSIKQMMENFPLEQKKEEIKFEKRKRYQAYQMLDYSLSNFTYFDFFSADAFQIAKNSKYIAQLYGKQNVSLEILLLPFFDSEYQVGHLLKNFGFNEIFIEKFSNEIKIIKKEENNLLNFFSFFKIFQNKSNKIIEMIFSQQEKEIIFNQQIGYTYQVHQLFEKSAENALNRFKTPVITPEILLITIMEEKQFRVSNLIKKNITDEINWYLLRYKLLKRLYSQESNIRSQVKKNQQFFAYLLKTQLPDANFEKLIENKVLNKAVSLFRNTLIHDLLKSNLFESFEEEIHASLYLAPKRKYSK